MNITLAKIRAQTPCKSGWETLLKAKGKTLAAQNHHGEHARLNNVD